MTDRFTDKSLIAAGRTSKVYVYEPGKVVKFLREGFPAAWLEEEAQRSHEITAAGLPAPFCFGLVEVEGQTGLVYEDAGAFTLGQVLLTKPWRVNKVAMQMAALQGDLHRVSPDGLVSLHELIRIRIQRSPALSITQKQTAVARLNQLPVGNALCHGDFHPWNVLVSNRGLLVIDWDNASVGSPVADIARSLLLIFAPRWFLIPFVNQYKATYFREIKKRESFDQKELEAWLPVMAAARTIENIPNQHEVLLRIVEKSYGR